MVRAIFAVPVAILGQVLSQTLRFQEGPDRPVSRGVYDAVHSFDAGTVGERYGA